MEVVLRSTEYGVYIRDSVTRIGTLGFVARLDLASESLVRSTPTLLKVRVYLFTLWAMTRSYLP